MIRSRTVLLAFSFGLICSGVMLPALADNTSVSKRGFISIPLVATNYNAGKIGKAILVPQGGKTAVHLELSGVPSYTSRPIHFYAYVYDGTCGNRSKTPRYDLTDHALADSLSGGVGIGASHGPVGRAQIIPVDFQTIRATHYAISVRASPADGDYEIFCGDNSH